EAIHGWQSAPEATVFLDDLQRLLHTLKGGARLAGLTALGNLSHNFETLLINVQARGTQPDAALMASILQYQDQLIAGVEAIKSGGTQARSAAAEMAPGPAGPMVGLE